MKPERWSQIDALFARALELPGEDRGPFLERASGGDPTLRAAVERLLAADEKAVNFLELEQPSHLGPYRIDRLLSRGGMGDVYLATRDDGRFERQVALKLLQHGSRDPEALQLFRAERQVLARLEHPSIARLYDAGETASGVPFLVMEYIEGLPLDVYCRENRLDTNERLRLFLRLLDAVSYAHRNLLVHRDLKPANILVTPSGEPKLLDFGIARRLEMDETLSFRRMTPAYASPEQARGDRITTASDVYSLGVVLYELLCGHRPDGERPSLHLKGPFRRDLDAIVFTAMRQDPQSRYRSVDEMAADIERYLKHLPVSVRRQSAYYHARKMVRRHPVGTGLGVLALALIVSLFAGVLEQRDRAEQERDKARSAMAFLVSMFGQADPYQSGKEDVTARELVAAGSRRAARELAGDPEVQAAMLDALGRASLGLGHIEEAEPLLRQSLATRRRTAPGSLELAESVEDVAWLDFLKGDFPAAERLLREALAIRRGLTGDDVHVGQILNRLGTVLVERYQNTDEARSREIEALHREALAIYEEIEGPDGMGVADSVFQLARVLEDRGDLAGAERLYRQTLRIDLARLPEAHPETSHCRRALAQLLSAQGRFREAESLLRQALAAQLRVLPEDHADIAWTRNDIGLVRYRAGDAAEAEVLFRQALRYAEANLGESHPHTLLLYHNVANALLDQGKPKEAVPLHEKALAGRREQFGEKHIYVAQTLGALSRSFSELGRHGEAQEKAGQALAISRELLQPGHPDLSGPLRTMGSVLMNAGKASEAEPYLRQSLGLLKKTPANDLQIARLEVLLGDCLGRLGRTGEAERLLTHGLRTLEAMLPPHHIRVQEARAKLAQLATVYSK
ncbi:MAG TPA: serine/threonine-protein kinase [Thermoanaerobaculia bacterium]|nr:serine/threonine-protein kinase [Thermoanaerobaculia bacterium]